MPETTQTKDVYTVIVGKREWQDYVTESIRALAGSSRPVLLKARGPNGAAKVALIACFFTSNDYLKTVNISISGIEREYDGEKSTVPEIEAMLTGFKE